MGSPHLGCTHVPSGGDLGAVISPSEREMALAARPLTAARPSETVAATPPALALGVILSAQLLVVLNVSIVAIIVGRGDLCAQRGLG
jgi:hypothetical protein